MERSKSRPTLAASSRGRGRRQCSGTRRISVMPIVGDRVRLNGRPSSRNRGRMSSARRVQLVSTAAKLELVTLNGGLSRCRRTHARELRRLDRRGVGAHRRPLPHRHPRHHHGQRLPPDRARTAPRVARVTARSPSATTSGSAPASSCWPASPSATTAASPPAASSKATSRPVRSPPASRPASSGTSER